MIPDIRKVQSGLEGKYQSTRPEREAALTALAEAGDMAALTADVNAEGAAIAKEATDAYRDLAQYLLVRFMDGNMKKVDEKGDFQYNEYGVPIYPSFPGYNQEYFDNIVRATGDHFLLPEKK